MKINCVFINNVPIYLTDSLQHAKQANFFDFKTCELPLLIDELFDNKWTAVYLFAENIKKLRKQFAKSFKVIKAAGGKVFNQQGKVLFIYRNGVWDLPKGKIEPGENKAAAALREVEEETAVTGLRLGDALETTYHMYRYKQKTVLKVSYWFEMSTPSLAALSPQLEEGITKVEWLDQTQILSVLPQSYANIQLLFN